PVHGPQSFAGLDGCDQRLVLDSGVGVAALHALPAAGLGLPPLGTGADTGGSADRHALVPDMGLCDPGHSPAGNRLYLCVLAAGADVRIRAWHDGGAGIGWYAGSTGDKVDPALPGGRDPLERAGPVR